MSAASSEGGDVGFLSTTASHSPVRYVRRYPAGYRRPDRLPWAVALPIVLAVSLLLWAGLIAFCLWLF